MTHRAAVVSPCPPQAFSRHPRRLGVPLPLLLLLFMGVLAVAEGRGAGTLTLLHTNDLHSELESFPDASSTGRLGGIARQAEMIAAIRRERPHTLVVGAGDQVQGTPFFQVFQGMAETEALSLAGYDFVTLGNHELDLGLPALARNLAAASYTMLCANVFTAKDLRPVFRPYRVVTVGSLTVGLIGVIGDPAWNDQGAPIRRRLLQIEPGAVLRSLVAHLRPVVDLVVVLSHSGLEIDRRLAREVPGIDAIVGAHDHYALATVTEVLAAQAAAGAPPALIVQAGDRGRFLGRLDLTIDGEGCRSHRFDLLPVLTPASGTSGATDAAGLPAHPVQALVASYGRRLAAIMDTPITEAPRGFFYDRNRRDKEFLPLGTLTCEAFRHLTGAEIGIINSGGVRAAIPSGTVTLRHLYQALPYDNTVTVVTMTGAELAAFLDGLCRNWLTNITGYQLAGLTASFDTRRQAVSDIRVEGKPLEPGRRYRLATSSFLTADPLRKGVFGPFLDTLEDSGVLMRDALGRLLREVPDLPPLNAPAITITGPRPTGFP
ncbi:MAG: bifunctional metallophosphatase/5'-nucleotidase [Candidatus Riflebacteria bacterium]|nr:bifunctional metallophosphatase/5'-nucleotidase [Candidatus Riflebacteria bacterium]